MQPKLRSPTDTWDVLDFVKIMTAEASELRRKKSQKGSPRRRAQDLQHIKDVLLGEDVSMNILRPVQES
eukprot:3523999-Prorocentrum_lima.AAC.1